MSKTIKESGIIKKSPPIWLMSIAVYIYKDVYQYTWGELFILLGCVTSEGKPDYKAGARYRMPYYRLKKTLETVNIEDIEQEAHIK